MMGRTPRGVTELITRAKAGDQDAFRDLVERHQAPLRSIIDRRLGGFLRKRVDVEDVLQETFLKALQSIEGFEDRGPNSFLHWLRGIAENLLLYWARQHQRTHLIQLDSRAQARDPSPSRVARRVERFERLVAAMERLAPDHREALLLARVDGLPVKEIARRMNRSPAATKQLLWRALQKLAAGFGETESFHLPATRFQNGEGRDDT